MRNSAFAAVGSEPVISCVFCARSTSSRTTFGSFIFFSCAIVEVPTASQRYFAARASADPCAFSKKNAARAAAVRDAKCGTQFEPLTSAADAGDDLLSSRYRA